jgi:hypothetical protein
MAVRIVAVVVVVSMSTIAVLSLRRSSDDVTTMDLSPLPALSPPILELPPAALAAHPATPDGWKVVSYGLGQVAVPAEWHHHPPGIEPCASPSGEVAVISGTAQVVPACPAARSLRLSTTTTSPCDACVALADINGLAVLQDQQPGCSTCATDYVVPELQLRIAETELDAAVFDQVLRTLTLSPTARALVDGPTLDVGSWHQVEHDGVTLRVPGSWPTTEITSATMSPGWCGRNPFGDPSPHVLLGRGNERICPSTDEARAPAPADGVWLWTLSGASDGLELNQLAVSGKIVRSIRPDAPDFLQLAIATSHGQVNLAVGVSTDPAIARTILRTIRIEGGVPGPVGSTVPHQTPTTGTPPMPHSTGADILTISATIRLPQSVTADPGALAVNQPCQGGGAYADVNPAAVVELRDADGRVLSSHALGAGTGYLANVDPADPHATLAPAGTDPQLVLVVQCGFRFSVSFNRVLQVSDHYDLVLGGRVLGSKTLAELQQPVDVFLGP